MTVKGGYRNRDEVDVSRQGSPSVCSRRTLTEDSSRSALTFIPPVTREIVSFPERSVTWTNVSLKLDTQ